MRSCSIGDIPVPSAGCPNGHLPFPCMLSQTGQEWTGYRNGVVPASSSCNNRDIPVPLPDSNGDILIPSTRLPPGFQAMRSGRDRRSSSPIGKELRGRDCARAGSACQGRCEAACKESAASSRSPQAPWNRQTRPARETEQDTAHEPAILPSPFKTRQEPALERHGRNGFGGGRSWEMFGVHAVLFIQPLPAVTRHLPNQRWVQDLNSG